jgi:fructan beta-fructosidase
MRFQGKQIMTMRIVQRPIPISRCFIQTVVLSVLFAIPAIGLSQSADEGRSIGIAERYLLIPVAKAGKAQRLLIRDANKLVHYMDVAVAGPGEEPLYWAPVNVAPYIGQNLALVLRAESPGGNRLDAVTQSSERKPNSNLYQERLRPQFHFSPQSGWTNDPNGLVWFAGEYHLFFQHNPFGTPWGNMTWGHAVSPDLIHWHELGDALHPDAFGTMYSGSAVVDHQNTAGFQTGDEAPIVTFYTAAGGHAPVKVPFTQCLAYSNDRGRTWTKYSGNPVVKNIADANRDPKVFWHEASSKWIMVLYVERGTSHLFGSADLKDWRLLSTVPFPDAYECPELFELPVDGDPADSRWVIWEGGSRHMIGKFDGQTFTPETEVLAAEWGANCYAAQTWNDVPDGRRVIIGWMRSGQEPYQNMPFNQQMTVPRTLSLRTTPDGIRLFAAPVREVEELRGKKQSWLNVPLGLDKALLSDVAGELFDIDLVISPQQSKSVTLIVGTTPIQFDTATDQLACREKTAPVGLINGQLHLRVLVDRTSIEVFVNDGRYVLSYAVQTQGGSTSLRLTADGAARVHSLDLWDLESIWPQR